MFGTITPAQDGALTELAGFRREFHGCLRGWADTVFELADAALCAPGPVTSFPALSLEPVFGRSHGSGYKALRGCDVDQEAVRGLLCETLPAGTRVFAVDASTWPRPDAETSPGRGYHYSTSASDSSGRPVTAGWCYQVVAGLDGQADSWTSPADMARIEPGQDQAAVTAEQIRALAGRLGPSSPAPLFVLDAGYDPAALAWELADSNVTLVVRVRGDRVFYEDPAPTEPGRPGRPARHGRKRRCAEPGDWPAPDRELVAHDPRRGEVTVRWWDGLHPRLARRGRFAGLARAPIIRTGVVRLDVERMPGPRGKPQQPLWLWVSGAPTDLDTVWRAYLHRFDIEHTFRFWKTTLGWTTPRFATPEQADTWTWLVAAAYTQLRLALPHVADHRLPWETKTDARLTPNRCRRGFRHLMPKLGTPAKPPKPSTPGPGRPKGSKSGPRQRHPVIKTTPTKV